MMCEMYEEYPHWMNENMIRAARYASIRHIRQTLVQGWSESCYVLSILGDPHPCLKGKWPNIKTLTEAI